MNQDLIKSLEDAPLWYLGTCSSDDPNVVPVGFKWLEGERLLIADLFFGKTRRNIDANPRVAVSVGALGPKRGFQIKGRAITHREGVVFGRVRALMDKDGLGEALQTVIEVAAEELFLLDPGGHAGERLK